MEIYNVQFVGGCADGTEMAVIGLNNQFYFRRLRELAYGDYKLRYLIETYVLLPETTIYVFKGTKEE